MRQDRHGLLRGRRRHRSTQRPEQPCPAPPSRIPVVPWLQRNPPALAPPRALKRTSGTTAFIADFQDAGAKGLNTEDYDASRWPARLAGISRIVAAHDTSDTAQDSGAQFDAAMTVCVMRYVSDLRIG